MELDACQEWAYLSDLGGIFSEYSFGCYELLERAST
jgi:hypothetical protein